MDTSEFRISDDSQGEEGSQARKCAHLILRVGGERVNQIVSQDEQMFSFERSVGRFLGSAIVRREPCQNKRLIETALGRHQPTHIRKAGIDQERGEFTSQQAAIL